MKKWIASIFLLIVYQSFGQTTIPFYPDSIFSTYYQQRYSHFLHLPQTDGDIIFLGNSITDGAEWSELFADPHIKNRGISGDITAGVLHRLNEVVCRKPSKIFLLIGINDLARNISTDSVKKNILQIADYIHEHSPITTLYVQSLLPVNNTFRSFTNHANKSDSISILNAKLSSNNVLHHYTYINIHDSFEDKEGRLDAQFTNDGLHQKGDGYILWKHLIYPYIYDVMSRPSLLPLPINLEWKKGFFPLTKNETIVVENDSLFDVATILAENLHVIGHRTALIKGHLDCKYSIKLIIENSKHTKDLEGYSLHVTETEIVLKSRTLHGLFNGVQTLKQLIRDELVDCCYIKDSPAFPWRGYMVDVGRNYQPIELLKKQIDIMANYKLNVFHFHSTEDIAWRIAIDSFPQLTATATMERNQGSWYTKEEILDLIQYCKDRYIEFIPEIDIPGHSAAFERAMHVSMQSREGISFLKQIFTIFCKMYPVDYIHIGGDEVKIKDSTFLPQMIELLQTLGKKTLGWSPGGNLDKSTIRQLWEGHEPIEDTKDHFFVDSRHLYINHMDPLESVVTIFFRQIGSVSKRNNSVLGGELCLWPDRNIKSVDDIFKQNPVYPAMLAFSERIWNGEGSKDWVANIGSPNTPEQKSFESFENRLLEQKQRFFVDYAFPYYKHANIIWNFYGPFENNGNLSKNFPFDNEMSDTSNAQPTFQSVGGTQILRHWWYPLVKGIIDNPKENTTYYARTRLWSEVDTIKSFWVGFNDLSRSYATNSPMFGYWDNRYSYLKVNNELIRTPHWAHADMKGDLNTPLVDENYAFRSPLAIHLKKGWNTILVKLPVGKFHSPDFNNPVKWMFTFLPI